MSDNTLFYFRSETIGSVIIAACIDLRTQHLREVLLYFESSHLRLQILKSPLLHANQDG